MRIVLINPPIDSVLEHGHVSPVTKYLFYNSAPLGILYIAAVLEQEGHVLFSDGGRALGQSDAVAADRDQVLSALRRRRLSEGVGEQDDSVCRQLGVSRHVLAAGVPH